MKKKKLYSELCYVLGLFILAAGVAMMAKADFGVSMVVAPAYILHVKLSQYLPFVTFGVAEYILQAFLLILLTIVVRRFKISYLLSFATAVVYGVVLDGFMLLVEFAPAQFIAVRIALYIVGMILSSIGVALFFNTYFPPEAYELFVKEVSEKFNLRMSRFKTVYDCVSCAVAILMSFAFFGLWHFEGVKLGTVLCALINGSLIGAISSFINKHFETVDKFKFRKFFTGK